MKDNEAERSRRAEDLLRKLGAHPRTMEAEDSDTAALPQSPSKPHPTIK